jgi:hypothetical protein
MPAIIRFKYRNPNVEYTKPLYGDWESRKLQIKQFLDETLDRELEYLIYEVTEEE